MSIDENIEKMKSIQDVLLRFLEDESKAEYIFDHFVRLVTTLKIINDKYEFKALLQIINRIAYGHQRVPNFISKIEQLLRHFKTEIQKYFSNSEILEIFTSNRRILLFLIEEKVMVVDEYIFSKFTSFDYGVKKFDEYFQPEIKLLLTKENIEKYGSKNESLKDAEFIEQMNNEVEENFYEKRREGENDDYLCELIRNNKIKEFITFVEQTNLRLEIEIKESDFETNQLLIQECKISFHKKNRIDLIEYASFYGSLDIIKYMQMKGVKLTSEMWKYSIHSRNAELIRYLEENHVSPPDNNYEEILKESIKCHHNDISNYIIENLIKEEDLQNNIEDNYYHNLYQYAAKFHNYCFFPTNMKYENMFFYLCEFDYYTLVNLYLSEGTIDINAKIKTSII